MRTHTRYPAWRSLATLSRPWRWWQMCNLSEVDFFGGRSVFYQTIHAAGLKEKGILVVVSHLL
jgi:hypothetical protein